MRKCISPFFSALLLIALSGCVGPVVKRPEVPAEVAPTSRADASTAFATAMGLALNGDMKTALPLFKTINPQGLNAKEQTAVAGVLANFDVRSSRKALSDLDAWTAKVLDAYQTYWSRVMMGGATAEAGERQLAESLAPLVGVADDGATPIDMAALEPGLEEQIRSRGYFSLHGVTSPFREFMLWRTQRDQSYEVVLPDGEEAVSVAMLEDFISLGWAGFATGNYYHSAGWATRERLFCVRRAYDLESESFRVSYLTHEAQHFSDYRRFPQLEGPELEYRAKLVEIAYAETTMPRLLRTFGKNGSDNRRHPHGYANRRLLSDLARTLNVTDPEGAWWETVPPATIRAAALHLFNADTQSLERGSPR